MSWQDIPGWTDDDLVRIYQHAVERAPAGAVFVEVGVAFGRSTALMAELLAAAQKDVRFHIVDNWKVTSWREPEYDALLLRHRGFYEAFSACLSLHAPDAWPYIDTIHKCDSVNASSLFDEGSVDFVFIDADHSEESVAADIRAWWPKVRPGGLLAGHDHIEAHPGVERAVRAAFGDRYACWGSCWHMTAPVAVHVPGVTP